MLSKAEWVHFLWFLHFLQRTCHCFCIVHVVLKNTIWSPTTVTAHTPKGTRNHRTGLFLWIVKWWEKLRCWTMQVRPSAFLCDNSCCKMPASHYWGPGSISGQFIGRAGTGVDASQSIWVSHVTHHSINFPYSSVTVPEVYDRPNEPAHYHKLLSSWSFILDPTCTKLGTLDRNVEFVKWAHCIVVLLVF